MTDIVLWLRNEADLSDPDTEEMLDDAADEIERLRKRLQACQSNDSTPLTDDFITQNERVLFSELEQLRALITAWADAEDALGRARGDDATVALRKAVGR